MHFSVLPVFAAFAAIVGFHGHFVNAQTLTAQWALDNPVTTFVAETNSFTLTYDVDDSIVLVNTLSMIYDKDCLEGGNDLVDATGIEDMTTAVATTGVATMNFNINTDILRQNPNVFKTGADNSAEMKICARFMLRTDDVSLEVNFIESVITITFDLTSGFELEAFAVVAKELEVTTTEKDYGAEAYLCDPANPLVSLDGTTFTQGSVVKVCVKPDQASIDDGLFLNFIDSFSWVRGAIEQPAVAAGLQADNGLTQFSCAPGAAVCSFVSMLYADFYQPPTRDPTITPTTAPVEELSGAACGCTEDGDGPIAQVPPSINTWEFQDIVTNYIDDTGGTTANSSRKLYGNKIGCWDVSLVRRMKYAFFNQKTFNEPIGCWNTESVGDFYSMFSYAAAFNQDIGGWDVSSSGNMHYMFHRATVFNQNIGEWQVSKVVQMSQMFYLAAAFNQNLCSWEFDLSTVNQGSAFVGSQCPNNYNSRATSCTACPLRRLATNDDDYYRSRNLQSDKTAEVGGLGTVTLQFGSSRRLADDERNLQDNPVANIGMTIGVTTLDDGPALLRTAGGATVGTTILTTILFAFIVGVFASTIIL